ncbi:lipid II flippase MurJ [Candidatus Methylopumilus planktonicus]|uniref:lipid II flippase MurJ n=1 Tax=Candidatus Methylopumilus planktonicus TaxID=1581557 RepID=UPI003BEF399B
MPEKLHKIVRKKAINSSFIVILFTSISFSGFFLRDYLMAKIYGFGRELDMFYLATMIPMFMVTVFCIPFGQSVVPMLKKIQTLDRNQFYQKVRNLAFLIFFICLFLCIASYILSDFIFVAFNYFGLIERNIDIKFMQITILPILLFSGLVILGNTVLSLCEHYVYPAFLQTIVPIFAIIFLLIFGKFMGVYAVILGMIFGQLINLVMVNNALKHEGVILMPLKAKKGIFNDQFLKNDYSHLVLIAIFSAMLIPINSFFCSTLGHGAVSIFNLGMKFSLFVMGIFSSLFTAILLPYLSKLSNYKSQNTLNKETFYMLLCGSLFFTFYSFLIFIYAQSISSLLFSYIAIENATILGLASVIKYSIIQLPFWVFNAIIFRHANAINRIGIILFSSIIALILNVILSLSLIKFMSVGGLALSITISSALSSVIILIYYGFKKYLNFFEILSIAALWFIFSATLIKMNVNPLLLLIEKLI